jgi:hypothetical protein
MKHLWIAAIAMALVPAIARADHRDSRYSFDRGSHYHHDSHSSFSFSFGFSNYGYSPRYYRYDDCAPVYRETRVYVPAYEPAVVYDTPTYYYAPPPAVIYAPPPPVYYYQPTYRSYCPPSYYSSGFRFSYRR